MDERMNAHIRAIHVLVYLVPEDFYAALGLCASTDTIHTSTVVAESHQFETCGRTLFNII